MPPYCQKPVRFVDKSQYVVVLQGTAWGSPAMTVPRESKTSTLRLGSRGEGFIFAGK